MASEQRALDSTWQTAPTLWPRCFSEVSHIHHLLVLLKAVGRRYDLARNSSVTWVWAVTSQPAAHPYMEPCPIRTIKRTQAVGNTASTAARSGAADRSIVLLWGPVTPLTSWKWTCELTPVQTAGDKINYWAPFPTGETEKHMLSLKGYAYTMIFVRIHLQRRLCSHVNQINCLNQIVWKTKSGEKTFSWNSYTRAACRAENSGLIINEVISQMDHILFFTILASNCYKIILAVCALSPFANKPNSLSARLLHI